MSIDLIRSQSMFIHPTDDYDFLVRMDSAALPRYAQNIDSSLASGGRYANLPQEDSPTLPRPGFDPARLLYDDLQVSLSSLCRSCNSSPFSVYMPTRLKFSAIHLAGTGSVPYGTRLSSSLGHSGSGEGFRVCR